MLPFERKQRTVITKRDETTDKKFGKNPETRTVKELLSCGIINLDKPAGPTSHQVSAYVKDIVRTNKAGHSGTLDPNVTGVQPVALGKGTRVTQSLLTAGKEYICLMHVHQTIAPNKIDRVFQDFSGKIKQLPPQKSAVKRQIRERHIYYLDLIETSDDGQDVLFRVGCQAGTYIRKLCHDIGRKLGCGAHMVELRRTKVGPFTEEGLSSLQDIKDAIHYHEQGDDAMIKKILLPIERGVQHLPKIWVMDSSVDSLCHGAMLKVPGIVKFHSGIELDAVVAVMTLKNELVGVGNAALTSKELERKDKGIAVQWQQVFMQPGLYPKIDRVI